LSETLDFKSDSYTWPLLCYMFACCLFPLASAVAHTFNVMSEKARHVCFFLDYSALSLFSLGVAISYHAYCFPEGLIDKGRGWFHKNYVCGSAFCAFLCTVASCSTRFMRPSAVRQVLRLSAFAVPYIYNSLPIIYRLFFYTEAERALASHWYHTRQFAFAITAAFLYASHFPERLKPGHFDIVGHSHQLFHVATILGVMDQLQATLIDMQERRPVLPQWVNFDLQHSLGLMALVLLVNSVIITAFSLYLYLAKNLHLSPSSPQLCKYKRS
jgi:predicted membrane channel-forming protein YqfA (hemolysin III family)